MDGYIYQKLTKALVNAFPNQAKLRRMVRFKLNKNLDELAMGENLEEIVFKLIETADAEGWVYNLVVAARESNPGNSLLIQVAQDLILTSIEPV